jgi:hypothetical protein
MLSGRFQLFFPQTDELIDLDDSSMLTVDQLTTRGPLEPESEFLRDAIRPAPQPRNDDATVAEFHLAAAERPRFAHSLAQRLKMVNDDLLIQRL